MGDFKDFKLNIRDGELKIAKEHNVQIRLISDYKWGSGWTSSQAEKFEDIVYDALRNASKDFYIEPCKDDLGCPHLKSREWRNKLDLYLHPQEFTGYANPEDLRLILKTLEKECKDVIYNIDLNIDRKVYDLTDAAYNELLFNNAKEIADKAAEIKAKYGHFGDIGFDYARECRIPRVGDGVGLGWSDTDIQAVSNIVKVADKLGYIDKQIELINESKKLEMPKKKTSERKNTYSKGNEKAREAYADDVINMLWVDEKCQTRSGGHSNSYITVELFKKHFTEEDKNKFEELIRNDVIKSNKSFNSLDNVLYAQILKSDGYDELIFDISKGCFEAAERLSKEFPDSIVFTDDCWDTHDWEVYQNGGIYSSYTMKWSENDWNPKGEEPEPDVEGDEEYYDCDVDVSIELPWGAVAYTSTGGGMCNAEEFAKYKSVIDNSAREKAKEENEMDER